MEALWAQLSSTVRQLAEGWATTTALGSFALYLVGYLSLRFRLTALGLGTDLDFVDERYLFEGVRFVIYLVATAANLLLLAPVLAALAYAARRWGRRLGRWREPPWLLAPAAVALLVIQVMMRKAFLVTDLLVGHAPPSDNVLAFALRSPDLYLQVLVLATGLTAAAFLASLDLATSGGTARMAVYLLGFLLAVQLLLLPVDYGTLVGASRKVPRVSSLDGTTPLGPGESAWLVWEGRSSATYYVVAEARPPEPYRRSLVTLAKDKVARTEITGYDDPVSLARAGPPRPPPAEAPAAEAAP